MKFAVEFVVFSLCYFVVVVLCHFMNDVLGICGGCDNNPMCLDGTDSVSCMFVTGRNLLLICAVGIRSAEFVPTVVSFRGLVRIW
jgi:hypothetical protein